jgi:LPXTG-site transpeptidase (sortase) family protein
MPNIVEQNCCCVNEIACSNGRCPFSRESRETRYRCTNGRKSRGTGTLRRNRRDFASNRMMSILDRYPKVTDRARALATKARPLLTRRVISLALVVIGVVLLGYVAGEYWGMYRSQKNLEAEWQRQAAAPSVPGSPAVAPDQTLTRLEIPKIQVDAIVVEGASRRELSEGPGHMKHTAQPGETGNAVITGHRDTFFRHIYELNKGDQIQVRRSGRLFTYEVTGKRIVMPEDISVIKPTTDPQLTLITCYPTYYIGPAPKRLVVFSKLVESDGQATNQAAQAHASGQ